MWQRLIWLGGSAFLPFLLLSAWWQQFHHLQSQSNAAAGSNKIMIDAVLYDGYEYGDADEAVAVRNTGNLEVDLSGWILSDGGVTETKLPPGTRLLPGKIFWLAKNEDAFFRQFGFLPDLILTPWPGYANVGDEVVLLDPQNNVVDQLVYGSQNTDLFEWQGSAVQPYTAGGLFGKEGQILYRKRDQASGLPISDTNSAADWAQSLSDPI